MAAEKFQPFRIDVADAVLDDLNTRLDLARFPVQAEGADWQWGSNLDYMKSLVAYWRTEYDWRKAEAELNEFPQFIAPVTDPESGEVFDIHFVHVKGSVGPGGAAPTPLLISHGWPGSFYELLGIVDALAHPENHGAADAPAFDVIVPSLPGYGFSSAPAAPITPKDMARVLHVLMTDVLGYDSYATQGGDWGSVVTAWMAQANPEQVRASHFNMLGLIPFVGKDSPPLTEAEANWAKTVRKRMKREGGYQAIQGTKPQTLAYGLTDSPVGLAAWIAEKFHGWPGAGADQAPPFSMDRLLTNIMIYWINGNINPANWLYISLMNGSGAALAEGQRVEVPSGFAFFPWDLFPPPPESWVKRAYNVVHRTDMASGGHFAAMERPNELITDIRLFFAKTL